MRLTAVNRFKALVSGAKKTPAVVQNLTRDELPTVSKVRGEEGDSSVLIDVKYSTINYKGEFFYSIIILGPLYESKCPHSYPSCSYKTWILTLN